MNTFLQCRWWSVSGMHTQEVNRWLLANIGKEFNGWSRTWMAGTITGWMIANEEDAIMFTLRFGI